MNALRGRVTAIAAGVAILAVMSAFGWGQTGTQSAPSQAVRQSAGAELSRQITAVLSDPAVARAHWGIDVTELDGTPIYGMNEAQFFQPASNAKLFTTAAAMALLGPERRFTTRVEYPASVDREKRLRGDITIVGAGDANLNEREFPYKPPAKTETDAAMVAEPPPPLRYLAEFADQIAASGVKEVRGDVVGDDMIFPWEPYPLDWSIDDMLWGYGAPVSGLSVEDNQIQVTISPGRTLKDKPKVEFQKGMPTYYRVDASELQTGVARSGTHVGIDREVGSKVLRVYGAIALKAQPTTEEIAIADPAEFAAAALKMLLEERGVKITGKARAKHQPANDVGFLGAARQPLTLPTTAVNGDVSALAAEDTSCVAACPVILEHTSPTLAEDITLANKVSQNLHAELMLHQLGKQYGTDGSTAQGVRVVRQFLMNAGLNGDDFAFFDGSGLSGHDLVTPRATARLLQFTAMDPKTNAPQPWFAQWKGSLPVAGVDGALLRRYENSPLAGHVFAKTGTLGEARALSGYVDCASGRTVIFSIMVGNHAPGTSADRDAIDKIVTAIAATN